MGPGFSAGEALDPYTTKKLYRRIHNRLSTQTAFDDVRYEPSRTRPRAVYAAVDPTNFVEDSYPVSHARLELQFDLRPNWDHYRIQWIESEQGLSCGWHQDQTHLDLGKCHFQTDFPDGSIDRTQAEYLDSHPLTVVETRLATLPEKLTDITSNHNRNFEQEP